MRTSPLLIFFEGTSWSFSRMASMSSYLVIINIFGFHFLIMRRSSFWTWFCFRLFNRSYWPILGGWFWSLRVRRLRSGFQIFFMFGMIIRLLRSKSFRMLLFFLMIIRRFRSHTLVGRLMSVARFSFRRGQFSYRFGWRSFPRLWMDIKFNRGYLLLWGFLSIRF